MNQILDDESLGTTYGVHYTPDGMWRIMCFFGTKLIVYKDIGGVFDIVQNITLGTGNAMKTCAITDDHQYIASNIGNMAYIFKFNSSTEQYD